jgi:hypothetical protein
MKPLSGWFLTGMAVACTACLPTITIENKVGQKGCQFRKISHDGFEVPFDKSVAVWQVANQCKEAAVVAVKNFSSPDDGKCYPVMTDCSTAPAPGGGESAIVCTVNEYCRRDAPYKYSIYINYAFAVDPQVTIKRDKPLEKKYRYKPIDETKCEAITCSGPTLDPGVGRGDLKD